MYKITLRQILPFMLSIWLLSCSSSKQAASLPERNDIKGSWLLDRITYDGIPAGQALKITLLDEGDDACNE